MVDPTHSGRKNMRTLYALSLLFALIACSEEPRVAETSPGTANTSSESERLNLWLDEQFEQELNFSPQRRTQLGDKTAYDQLDDVSEESSDAELNWRRQSIATMQAQFDYQLLNEEARTSYDLQIFLLERAERGQAFRRHSYLLDRGGPHTGLVNFMVNYHRVDDANDMRAYISRLQQIDDVMRQYLQRAQLSTADGIRQPRFDYRFAMDEINRVTRGAPFTEGANSALWDDASAKINNLLSTGLISAAEAEQYKEQAQQALVEQLLPAYTEISNWLQTDIVNSSEQANGVWALPFGDTYYSFQLSLMTTLDLSADEIHEIGLSEVTRIRAAMEAIKNSVGFTGSLQEFFVYMRDDRQFYFPDTDEGRQAYIDLAEHYLDGIAAALPDFFGILPQAPLVVKRVEAYREQAGAAQHYMRATPDGSIPGTFYAHLSDMRAMPRYQLENISYHEGNPGHHMQISIAQELKDIPRFRTQSGYTAFSEGWGLYTEALGKEMGFYQDPYSDFGRLAGEIWRAIRLVVDTGLHSKRWTEDQAVHYFLDNSPQPEAAIRSEIQRYLNNPGQATAYKIGMLKIQELRETARTRLGDRFDIRQFHDTVLGGGALPLPVLEARVNRWIERTLN
jgi:uncharacterized protein (DUF885 family)